ncbi:hypothetical protein NDU88_005749 [Pleurodeles waltl]|uniref:Uncharacterized protein n=1 Tax=Pleurodeles waltl TaxID=8319 RepID=A0AAV7TCI1_PLEWA|nr:hypothetical protein NDU88_005749 [Pleurodeles waltl]
MLRAASEIRMENYWACHEVFYDHGSLRESYSCQLHEEKTCFSGTRYCTRDFVSQIPEQQRSGSEERGAEHSPRKHPGGNT